MGVANRDHPFVHPSPCAFPRHMSVYTCVHLDPFTLPRLPVFAALALAILFTPSLYISSWTKSISLSLFLYIFLSISLFSLPSLSFIRTSLQRLPRRVFLLHIIANINYFTFVSLARTFAHVCTLVHSQNPHYHQISLAYKYLHVFAFVVFFIVDRINLFSFVVSSPAQCGSPPMLSKPIPLNLFLQHRETP